MGAKKKYGKYQWPVVTKMMGGWKLVTVNVENSKKLMIERLSLVLILF